MPSAMCWAVFPKVASKFTVAVIILRFEVLPSRLPKIRHVYPQNAAIPFLPTAIILQSVGRDVSGFWTEGLFLYPPSNLRTCVLKTKWYTAAKKQDERYRRGVCVGRGPHSTLYRNMGFSTGRRLVNRMWVTGWSARRARLHASGQQ